MAATTTSVSPNGKRYHQATNVRNNSASTGYLRLLNFKEKLREGQSNSLSETIENAIDQSPIPPNPSLHLKNQKLFVKKLD